jgi:hypothetical protein
MSIAWLESVNARGGSERGGMMGQGFEVEGIKKVQHAGHTQARYMHETSRDTGENV